MYEEANSPDKAGFSFAPEPEYGSILTLWHVGVSVRKPLERTAVHILQDSIQNKLNKSDLRKA